MGVRLADIARRFRLSLHGDGDRELVGVCALSPGVPDRLAYLADPRHGRDLANTRAGAVILGGDIVDRCPVPALVADDPQLAYAKVAGLFEVAPPEPGIHPSAVVDETAAVDPGASVGACAVVAAGAAVAAGTVLGPGSILGPNAVVGADCRIGANAVIGDNVKLGARVRVEAGAILGARGFGLAREGERWVPIPQLGGVTVGDDVEIGAGCTIDRGAIEDTVLEEGVKLDDQVHIAHNCRIGAHTVIAGCAGIAGSSTIGKRCMIGGLVGIGDHVTIADDVMLTGATQVPSDIRQPGLYSSTLWPMPAGDWRRRVALLRKLDRMEERLRTLERGRDND